MKCKTCGFPIHQFSEKYWIHSNTNDFCCYDVGGERARPEITEEVVKTKRNIQRDTQEFFDWWYERIDKFEKMYPWARVDSWGTGVTIRIKDKSTISTHLPEAIFLKMIGEDKFWWEY